MKAIQLWICLLMTFGMTMSVWAEEKIDDKKLLREIAPVVDGNTAFALDLYSQLRSEKGNLFFSPYSISTALAMTYAGLMVRRPIR